MSAESPVVLFDGVCNFCNGSVQFIVDHERDRELRFASLQSAAGAQLLVAHGRRPLAEGEAPDSILVVADGRLYEQSAAALRIARHLSRPWNLARVFVLVPRPLRDLVYRFVARNRYRWFGRTEQCRVPTTALRMRFVPDPA